MFGPKLDSKSYTTFLLIVIGVLLSINLFAQVGTPRTEERFDSTATWREVAAANSAVASATLQVAASNQAIADAIRQLAGSVDAKRALNVTVTMAGEGEAFPAEGGASAGLDPSADEEGPRGSLQVR